MIAKGAIKPQETHWNPHFCVDFGQNYFLELEPILG